jgi:hypothetical protein
MRTGDAVCVEQRGSSLEHFFEQIHPAIDTPYILVSVPGPDDVFECLPEKWPAGWSRRALEAWWILDGLPCPRAPRTKDEIPHHRIIKSIHFASDRARSEAVLSVAGEIASLREDRSWAPRDVVMALAHNFRKLEIFEVFVNSLRATGFSGPVVIGVDRDLPQSVERFLTEKGVWLQYLDAIESRANMYFLRFLLAAQWTRILRPAGHVLVVDFRDVLFQRNPFDDPMLAAPVSSDPHEPRPKPRLYAFEESPRVAVGECDYNAVWVRECEGEAALASIAHENIINCGTILGDAAGYLAWAKLLEAGCALENEACSDFGCKGSDQALHQVARSRRRTCSASLRPAQRASDGMPAPRCFLPNVSIRPRTFSPDGRRPLLRSLLILPFNVCRSRSQNIAAPRPPGPLPPLKRPLASLPPP